MKLIKKIKTPALKKVSFCGIPLVCQYTRSGKVKKKVLFGLSKTYKNRGYETKYICGLPISYKCLFFPTRWEDTYTDVLVRAFNHGFTKRVAMEYDLIVDSGDIFYKCDFANLFHALLVSLILEKQYDKAKILLRRSLPLFGYVWMGCDLNVLSFAYEQGYVTDVTRKGYEILQVVNKNLEENLFENYLKGKTIAIVGNGGMELGKGKGKEIDAHDIVIRFNNYPKGYEKDYGSKTSIWARGEGASADDLDTLQCRNVDDIDFIVQRLNSANYNLSYEKQFDDLYQIVKKYPKKLVFFQYKYQLEMEDKYDLFFPSTGAMMIYMVLQIVPMSNVDVYGFSFLYDSTDYSHFYDNKSRLGIDHPMTVESDVLKQIYASKKK